MRPGTAGLLLLASIALGSIPGAEFSYAQTAPEAAQGETGPNLYDIKGLENVPAVLSADVVTYDDKAKVVTAEGNVEIAQGSRVLLADRISYDTEKEVVTAEGNISLLDPSGHVLFADFVELTGDLREGFIRNIRLLLSDQSRMAADSAERLEGNITELRNAVYSPCLPCKEDPEAPPLWQIKAVRIVHDQQQRVIKYRDAWMELFGVPIAYTPYFEHADPTVKRKSGFLAPSFGSSTLLGQTVSVPYFWAIAPDRDATFDPVFTTKQSVVLAGEYRQILPQGEMRFRGSGTIADRENDQGEIEDDQLRGHVDASGRFDINETWRWGFDLQRTSDDTYTRIFDISSERTLTSQAFVEGFRGRNHMSVQNFLYQGLRSSDVNDELPIIVPLLDYSFVSEPGLAGGIYRLDANFLNLARLEGRESHRLSLLGGWELPHTSPAGDVITLRAQLQGDAYYVEDVDPDSNDPNPVGNTESGLTGRFFPQLAVEWRYPWVSHAGGLSQVVEPIAQAVLAPGGSNPDLIPNEDSLDFEFDDTNLFSLNRFAGRDRVDPGTRVDYGLKYTVTGAKSGFASAFVGQSYRLEKSDLFREQSGLENNFSDIVGRLQLRPNRFVDLSYRFRLDHDNLTVRRNEVNLQAGPPALNVGLSYLDLQGGVNEELFGGREELVVTLSSRLNDNWTAFVTHQRDLDIGEELETSFGLKYEDECFLITGQVFRSRFEDRDVQPEDAVYFTFGLKNLGQFASN
jgi:LPS-assembly protein